MRDIHLDVQSRIPPASQKISVRNIRYQTIQFRFQRGAIES